MKNFVFFIAMIICNASQTHAQRGTQTSDSLYTMPLKDVLQLVEKQFGVRVKFTDSMVKDRAVTYARWRFRDGDVDQTLANVLAPLDMKVNKEGDKKYKLKYFEYYRWSVEDGQRELNMLASKYNNRTEWEARKSALRSCMYEALQLSPMPPKPRSQPILANKRTMDGYTVENIAIETLPGLYVCGSIYEPLHSKGKIPVVLCPDGHWEHGRYRPDCQYRCATLARMGCMAVSYDLFAWGESLLQFKDEDHRRSLAETVQLLNGIRILDYMLSLKNADPARVAISGGSGGGTQTMMMTALDERITLSAPVVSLSCYMYGGCPCESGMPLQFCGGSTDNAEIAAMAAPRPMLVISDGKDWTDHVPQIEFPYLQKMYGYYGKNGDLENVHLPNDNHDFDISKRAPLYAFIGRHFGLNMALVKDASGAIDERKVTIEPEAAMYVFGAHGERLPANAIKGFTALQTEFNTLTK